MGDNTLVIGFDNQSKPFDQIVQSANFPTVIKYDTAQEVDPNLIGPGFDPVQTYLLHSTHDIWRVQARSAKFHPASKSFEDSGLDVSVDENYAGWFAVFGNPSENRADLVVPHFRSIGKLAISPCDIFLVSGRQPLDAMKVFRHENGTKSLKPFQIYPGAMLTKVGMYTVSLKIKIKRSLFKPKVVKKDEMYMACVDEMNNEMLIPCSGTGVFYVLSQVSGQIKTPVMKMESIMKRHKFPLLVKLVHGHTIQMPSTCNGTLILLKSKHMKTNFASTLYAPQPAIIEIASDASLRFFSATTTRDIGSGDDNIFSKACQTYSDKMINLLQTIRFRYNYQGLTSARSSATSGHGSGLSDDDERYDWSQTAVCSNAPFIETTDLNEESSALYTHHVTHPTTIQTQTSQSKADKKSKSNAKLKKELSQDKDKRTKVETTAIKRTSLYDSPKPANLDTIPFAQSRRLSQDSNASSSTPHHDYGNIQFSPTVESPTEYFPLWSDDASSVTSGESLEVEVENVTHSGVQNEDASAHGYTNLSSELAATVRLRNKSRKSISSILTSNNDAQEDENTYDFLSDNPYRNTLKGGYQKLIQPQDCPSTASATSGMFQGCDNDENDSVRGAHALDFNKNRTDSTRTYEEPNYGTHERPKNGTYEKPKNGTYERPDNETYKNSTTCIYEMPESGAYVTPSPQTYEEQRNSEPHNDSYQDDGIVYESVEDIYDCIADLNLDLPKAPPVQYVNLSKPSVYMNSENQTVNVSASSSSAHGVYVNHDALPEYKSPNSSCLYLQTPSTPSSDASCSNVIHQKLLTNMKTLGLKQATEEAIRNIDTQKLELNFEDTDLRSRLSELFPKMNKIDLNKISLFLDGTQTS